MRVSDGGIGFGGIESDVVVGKLGERPESGEFELVGFELEVRLMIGGEGGSEEVVADQSRG